MRVRTIVVLAIGAATTVGITRHASFQTHAVLLLAVTAWTCAFYRFRVWVGKLNWATFVQYCLYCFLYLDRFLGLKAFLHLCYFDRWDIECRDCCVWSKFFCFNNNLRFFGWCFRFCRFCRFCFQRFPTRDIFLLRRLFLHLYQAAYFVSFIWRFGVTHLNGSTLAARNLNSIFGLLGSLR